MKAFEESQREARKTDLGTPQPVPPHAVATSSRRRGHEGAAARRGGGAFKWHDHRWEKTTTQVTHSSAKCWGDKGLVQEPGTSLRDTRRTSRRVWRSFSLLQRQHSAVMQRWCLWTLTSRSGVTQTPHSWAGWCLSWHQYQGLLSWRSRPQRVPLH